MKATKTERGFVLVEHEEYLSKEQSRVVQESSAIGDYEDSMSKPGGSFLWIGEKHHLNREDVSTLIKQMKHWLKTGRLKVDE